MSTVDQDSSETSKNLPAEGTREPSLPPFVTFKTGAVLLIERGLVESITADGVRYIAREDDDWPFGDKPGRIPYVMVGNARTMATSPFLAFFEKHRGRGGRGNKHKVKP